jgi:hypothetical protein
MMMLEKLGLALGTEETEQEVLQRSLMQRLQAALDDPSTNPPPEAGLPVEPDAGLPVEPDDEDIAELTRKWAVKMFCDEFMMTAIFGDNDRFPKPDED